MLYDELKNIKTEMLLSKISSYADSANGLIKDNRIDEAIEVLNNISFFAKYHECVNLRNPEDYDDESLRLIKKRDIVG